MEESDSLKEISADDLPSILDEWMADIPYCVDEYNFLSSLIKWKKFDPTVELKVFRPATNADCKFVVFFLRVAGTSWNPGTMLKWSHRTDDDLFIQESLRKSKLLPWNEEQLMFSLSHSDTLDIARPVIAEKWDSKGVQWNEGLSFLYWVHKDVAKNWIVDVPQGTYLSFLKPEHAVEITDHWEHRFEGSAEFFAKIIEFNFGLGLFESKTGELISWAIQSFYGSIGILHTKELHRKKGYGSVVVKAIAKEIANRGLHVTAHSLEANITSQRLFHQLGFEVASKVSWLNEVQPSTPVGSDTGTAENIEESDSLKEISPVDIPSILDEWMADIPYCVNEYNFLSSLIIWKKFDPNVELKVFRPAANADSKFVVFFLRVTGTSWNPGAMLKWSHKTDDNLFIQESLRKSKLLPWNEEQLMFSLSHSNTFNIVRPVIMEKWDSKGVQWNEELTILYWVHKDVAKNWIVDVPQGTYLSFLKPEHAVEITDHWEYKFEGSAEFFAKIIEFHFGLGLFESKTGELISWAIQSFYGSIGMLHTKELHRKKGYGGIVVKAIAKEIANRGLHPTAHSIEANVTSQRLFHQLGFEVASKVSWLNEVQPLTPVVSDTGTVKKMEESDSLKEIPPVDITSILDEWMADIPYCIDAYNFLSSLIKWKKFDPNVELKVLRPAANTDCKFVVFFLRPTGAPWTLGSMLKWSHRTDDDLLIQESLKKTQLLPWNEDKLLFSLLRPGTLKIVKPVLAEKWDSKGIQWNDDPEFLYWVHKDVAKHWKIDAPPNTYMAFLTPEHAVEINNPWKHKFEGSANFFAKVIQFNFGLGLFDSKNGELISWAIQSFYGSIAVLHTKELHRKKGYGSFIVRAISKEIANRGFHVTATTLIDNVTSQRLFDKLGFQVAFKGSWLYESKFSTSVGKS